MKRFRLTHRVTLDGPLGPSAARFVPLSDLKWRSGNLNPRSRRHVNMTENARTTSPPTLPPILRHARTRSHSRSHAHPLYPELFPALKRPPRPPPPFTLGQYGNRTSNNRESRQRR